MTTEIDDVPNFDITVKRSSLEDDMFAIYSRLFKDETTTKDQLSFEELCGGYVNAIWKVTPKDKSKSLIFRTFGMKFDEEEVAKNMANMSEKGQLSEEMAQNPDDLLLFSRLSEFKAMQVLALHGLCQPVHARYKNGLVYGFTEGHTVTSELMLTNEFLNEAARKIARFHSIKYEVPGIKFKNHLERLELHFGPPFEIMLKEADAKVQQEGRPYPYSEIPLIQDQFDLKKKIMSLLKEVGLGRTVMCHNDLNQKNMIWDEQTGSLRFIDFELTMTNYQALEFGLLFSCFPGHFLCSWDREAFPNEQHRRRFLRTYLEEFYKLNGLDAGGEETELEDLFHQVNLATLWSLIHATSLGVFFDFNPNMFKNEVMKRDNEKYFAGKFSLKIYQLFQELYESFFEDAKRHFAKRKQASSS